MADLRGRVLVTGACGFIGSHLVRRLLAANFDVVALDDLSVGHLSALPSSANLRVVVGSVTDAVAVREATAGCTTVFHLAGLVGMDLVTEHPGETYRVSVVGTEVVLAAAAAIPVVLLSSSCIYGHTGDQLCRESEQLPRARALGFDGGSPGYATGKWDMEAMARRATLAGQNVLAVRPFNVVGPGQSHRHGMVLPRFLRAAQRAEPLVIYGDGEQCRAFSSVTDFVAALVRLAMIPAEWSACDHLVNLGSSKSTSILELARAVIEATGSRSSITYASYARRYPGRDDVRQRVPDGSRVERLLGALSWTDVRAVVGAIARSTGSQHLHAPDSQSESCT